MVLDRYVNFQFYLQHNLLTNTHHVHCCDLLTFFSFLCFYLKVSNTPRGSPTPEDAECAAIIQAVIHAVSQTIRINPSPPPEALDFMSGSMLPTIDRPKFPDLKCP